MGRNGRSFGGRTPKAVFRVACEDSKSAPAYLQALGWRYEAHVSIQPIRLRSNQTDPRQVVKRAIEDRERRGVGGEDDSWWVLCDAEPQAGAHRRKLVAEARQLATTADVVMVISKPCLEYWLLLHLCEGGQVFASSKEATRRLEAEWHGVLGRRYTKSGADFRPLVGGDRQDGAIDLARREHTRLGAGDLDSVQSWTEAYKLIDALEAVAARRSELGR